MLVEPAGSAKAAGGRPLRNDALRVGKERMRKLMQLHGARAALIELVSQNHDLVRIADVMDRGNLAA